MKYTEKDYIERCKELNVEYIGNHKEKNTGTIIEFICNKHRDKGIQYSDWGHFRVRKKSCKYCAGRRNTEEAQKLVLNKNIEFLSEYKGSEKPIKCKCHKCGHVWITNRPIDLFKRPGG